MTPTAPWLAHTHINTKFTPHKNRTSTSHQEIKKFFNKVHIYDSPRNNPQLKNKKDDNFMPSQFNFIASDPVVINTLTEEEINEVSTWQNDYPEFKFEFHTMHEAGWPCYLREPNGPNRGLPKVNLKNYCGQLLQGESVRSQECSSEFMRVISGNLELFQKLAKEYYEGKEVNIELKKFWYVKYKCAYSKKAPLIIIQLPARGQAIAEIFWLNMQNWAKKPECVLHKHTSCMLPATLEPFDKGEIKEFNYTYRYKDNGEIEEI
ncbi:hypothetical protein ACJJH9_11150 [Microbulbifer sp. DLAB2-AF]|uniref:hypothetical protein n=1 Tax=Microbulbifer sp. DLAB2-AF TaxID=3243395 RepID=UPI00403A3279